MTSSNVMVSEIGEGEQGIDVKDRKMGK